MTALRVGLVGAGPWASDLHGPGLKAHPDVELAGVWARRPEAAQGLADALDVTGYRDVDALIGDVDAVAFAVAPVAQGEYGLRAARAGRHLILDKPLAADLPTAEALVDASTELTTAVFLTTRYTPSGERFVADAAQNGPWSGAVATWVSGGILSGPYSRSPWRQDDGALWDVGPHAVDTTSAAIGPVAEVLAAARSDPDYVTLTLRHEGGAVSQLSLGLRIPTEQGTAIRLFGPTGSLDLDRSAGDATEAYRTMVSQFAAHVRGDGPPPTCTAAHALGIHRVLQAASDVIGR